MEQMALTPDMITVMAVILFAVFLFIVEWVRVDVVAILVMIALPLLNLIVAGEYTFIKPDDVFSGFSSNAVISIIAVIIVGAGLDKTGIVNRIVEPILKLSGKSESRLMTFISGTVAIISSFMQNIGAAALFLPAIKRACKTSNIPISRMLMPVGFCAILGGTVTLVGSSPLILLNDLLKPFDLEGFGLFDVTPVGLALVVSGILLFMFFGRLILPGGTKGGETAEEAAGERDLLKSYGNIGGPYELKTSSAYSGITVRELREKYFVRVVDMVAPSGQRTMAPVPDEQIGPDTDLAVCGFEHHAHEMAGKEGMFFQKELDIFKDDLSPNVSGTVEAVISPRSNLEGKTLSDVNFQKKYNVTPIAIFRNGQVLYSVLVDIALRPGDAILFHGKWDSLKLIQKDRDLVLSTPIEVEPMKPEKAFFAVAWFVVAMVMIMLGIKLSICLMTGALGLILTRVLTIDEAYEAVDWRTIFLLAGLIPLGIATQKSGSAEWIAKTVLSIVGTVPEIVLYSIIALLSTIFTLVISNVGATVLLVPLVIAMANEAGADPRMAALIVGIATSNSFLLPTHQVNALYMGPGKYKSIDFIKAGSILSIVFIVVLIAMIYVLKMVGFY